MKALGHANEIVPLGTPGQWKTGNALAFANVESPFSGPAVVPDITSGAILPPLTNESSPARQEFDFLAKAGARPVRSAPLEKGAAREDFGGPSVRSRWPRP